MYDTIGQMGLQTASCVVAEPLRARLERRRKDAALSLATIDAALAFLDANPNFEAFHDVVAKAGF